jgi:hypothetical protein
LLTRKKKKKTQETIRRGTQLLFCTNRRRGGRRRRRRSRAAKTKTMRSEGEERGEHTVLELFVALVVGPNSGGSFELRGDSNAFRHIQPCSL